MRQLPTYQDLSGEQQRVYELPLDGTYLVTGPPGTGKTVMALYRAQQHNRAGRTVVLLSFGRMLNDFMGEGARQLGLGPTQVMTYTLWLKRLFNGHVPLLPNSQSNWDYDWSEIIRRAPGLPKVSSLVIDEGQDLPQPFYVLARTISDHLTVFADENQRIFEDQSTIADIRTWMGNCPEYKLTMNYRNSRTIAELAAHFYTGLQTGIPDLPPMGDHEPAIVVKKFGGTGLTEDVGSAQRIVSQASLNQGNASRDIGAFAPDARSARFMGHRFDDDTELERREDRDDRWPCVLQYYYSWLRGMPPAPEILFGLPGVLLTNFFNAKGLEFDTLYLTRLQKLYRKLEDPLTRMLFFVLISRARTTLEFHYSGNGEPEIIEFLRTLPTGTVTFET